MLFPQIRCFHSSQVESPFTFFILSKGENAGRPGLQPWANSYYVCCHNQEQFEFYFWLTFGLHKAGHFKTYQMGSVIPFLKIADVIGVLKEAVPVIAEHWQKFKQILSAIELLEKTKSTLGQQLVSTQNLQEYLIRNFLVKYK
ncbi:MAG: hypothetical protein JST81_13700 [Bacteroidetes bacterium]|nr:hypothetical protein [Bacteroidota bacterium]